MGARASPVSLLVPAPACLMYVALVIDFSPLSPGRAGMEVVWFTPDTQEPRSLQKEGFSGAARALAGWGPQTLCGLPLNSVWAPAPWVLFPCPSWNLLAKVWVWWFCALSLWPVATGKKQKLAGKQAERSPLHLLGWPQPQAAGSSFCCLSHWLHIH